MPTFAPDMPNLYVHSRKYMVQFKMLLLLLSCQRLLPKRFALKGKICEFLQNSSEFVLASVLGNPNSNLISPAEFQISVDFPTKYNFLGFQGW